MQSHEIQACELGCECLCRSHTNFRTCPCIENSIRNASCHRPDDIRDRQAPSMIPELALGGDRVERLSGLRNKNEESVGKNYRIAVSILARIIDFDGKARHRFDHVLPGSRGMPTCAAPENANVLEALPHIIPERDVFKMNPVTFE